MALVLIFFLISVLSPCNGAVNGLTQPGHRLVNDTSRHTIDPYGAIIRGDLSEKKIALVLTGDEFGDGGAYILQTLRKHHVKASFFLTGNFYSNPDFRNVIRDLKKHGHYLGAHSDKHLLYADWSKRDSLLVTETEFKNDLFANYQRMAQYGIAKDDALYFLPPYEWYNRSVSDWTRDLGLQLINFTPGTRSAADYTYPEMKDRYVSSDEIYKSILSFEEKDKHGLNGFILLIHIGTDPRRTDKFYNKLDDLLKTLKDKGYELVTVPELLN